MKKTIQAYFFDHPESVGESYLQHLSKASRFAARLVWAGLACLLHGLFPFLFVKTGSRIITQLHDSMVIHRSQVAEQAANDQLQSSKA
jgi:hypothetical protein